MSTVVSESNVNPRGDGYDDDGSAPDVVVKSDVYLAGHRDGFYGTATTHLYNYGRIYGGKIGVANADVVINFGQIRSDNTAIGSPPSFYNYGTILSAHTEIVLQGHIKKFLNNGIMRGDVGIASDSGGINGLIVNNGTIDGSAGADASLGLFAIIEGRFSLANSGTIIGLIQTIPVIGATATATIANTGHIDGDLRIDAGSGGTFRYDGRQGTISGTIYAEHSESVIRAGNDGETIETYGNAPDYVYEGAGADTLSLFAELGTPHWTYVANFDPGKDHIALDHGIETALAPGQAPEFAIATAPTSATDHLYLNPNSGVLYYDPDGTGSQAATALAHFRPGTALSASNFKVT